MTCWRQPLIDPGFLLAGARVRHRREGTSRARRGPFV